jgi:hypothetical protein
MKKIIKLTESQLEMLTEKRVEELSTSQMVTVLRDLPCTGENIKTLITEKLTELGFGTVNIKFLGYGENKKVLQYIVYTEGPIFVVDTISDSEAEPPCLEVINVVAYNKI